MELLAGIESIRPSLWLKVSKTLILGDLHLGYEENLQQGGLLIPKFQLEQILLQLQKIFQKIKPKQIIINGDLKHQFSKISTQEWNDALRVIDYLQRICKNIILIRGNHDTIIESIARQKNLSIVNEYQIDKTLIIHGDKLIETDAKIIIIGHEHPAVTLKDQSKSEKYKCFLKGKWQNKQLIVMPSFNPLLEGTNLLTQKTLSPFLDNIDNFEVFAVGEEQTYNLGKIKKLKEMNNKN